MLPLLQTGGGGSGGGGSTFLPTILDPTQFVFMFTDFITQVGAANASMPAGLGAFSPSVAGSAIVSNVVGEVGTYGLIQAATGATNGSVAILTIGGNWGNTYNNTVFDMKFRVKVNSTTTVVYWFGVNKNEAAGDGSSDQIAISYDSSQDGTTWHAVTRSASGSIVRTDIGAAVQTSTYATLRIRCLVAGTILFSVDGGSELSISSGLPSVVLAPQFSIKSLSTNNSNFKADYFWHWYTLTR